MTTPPWTLMRMRRKELGLTQRELAHGSVTQSLISQVETGRVIPGERLLRELALRLKLEPADLCSKWEPWRHRHAVRSYLWMAGLTLNQEELTKLLVDSADMLVPFEGLVYWALLEACETAYESANRRLFQAWSKEVADQSGLSYGHKLRGCTGGQLDARVDDQGVPAWTTLDYARALVMEAKTREIINRGIHRWEAAEYWRQKANARMKDTVQMGYNGISSAVRPP